MTADKMFLTRVTIIAFLAAASCWTADAGELYHVTCPNIYTYLTCPEGQVLEVLKLDYGVKGDADCDTRVRDQPAPVSTKDCIHPLVLPLVKLVCDKLERCLLPKPSPRMFTCDASPDNFVQVTYQCNPRQPNERTHITCEGELAEIKCETGVINIVKANFGRVDATTCTNTPARFTCTSYGAEPIMRLLCDGKKECSLPATVKYLGEPTACSHVPKYLLVDHVCV